MNPKIKGVRHREAADPRLRASAGRRGSSGRSSGCSPTKPATAAAAGRDVRRRSGRRATTRTGRSSPGEPGRLRGDEPADGAAFNFWHPNLVTMHVWLWYPNPGGLFSGTNPLVAPFQRGVGATAGLCGFRRAGLGRGRRLPPAPSCRVVRSGPPRASGRATSGRCPAPRSVNAETASAGGGLPPRDLGEHLRDQERVVNLVHHRRRVNWVDPGSSCTSRRSW